MVEKTLTENTSEFYGVIDEMGKTALHLACEKNLFEVVKMIINTLFTGQKQSVTTNSENIELDKISRSEYVNRQNYDGLTALHYAAFRGNIPVIKYLTELGANPFLKDKDGHNVIHIAAQGDQVAAIYFFIQNFNFDINDKDSRQSTALHWAAFLNKEIALSYLLAWGAEVSAEDTDHNTPLHLAVDTAEKVKETRCAKILLLKGADRDIKNSRGNKPIDLIRRGDMEEELRSILHKPKY